MNFHTVDYSELKVTPKLMSCDFPINYKSEDVEKKLSPVLVHLSCVFADWTWEIGHLFNAINKGRFFKNCMPKLSDWLVDLSK